MRSTTRHRLKVNESLACSGRMAGGGCQAVGQEGCLAHISWQISITLKVGKKASFDGTGEKFFCSERKKRGRGRRGEGHLPPTSQRQTAQKKIEPFAAFSYQRITTFRGFAILVVTFYERQDLVWVLKCVTVCLSVFLCGGGGGGDECAWMCFYVSLYVPGRVHLSVGKCVCMLFWGNKHVDKNVHVRVIVIGVCVGVCVSKGLGVLDGWVRVISCLSVLV